MLVSLRRTFISGVFRLTDRNVFFNCYSFNVSAITVLLVEVSMYSNEYQD